MNHLYLLFLDWFYSEKCEIHIFSNNFFLSNLFLLGTEIINFRSLVETEMIFIFLYFDYLFIKLYICHGHTL